MRLNFNAFGACAATIAARGRMTETEARQILQEVADRAEQMRLSGQADPFVTAAGQMARQLKQTAVLDRIDALRNATIRRKIVNDVAAKGGIRKAILVLRSLLHGTNIGSRDNIQTSWRSLASMWSGKIDHALNTAGVLKVAIKGSLDSEVAEALWRAHGGTPDPRVTISQQGQAIADAFKPWQDVARTRLNDAGARISDAMDYVAHTDHDPRKMRAAAGPTKTADEAFAAWWQAEQPRWAQSTFANLTPRIGETRQQARDRFGRSVFDALVSGVHMTADGVSGLAVGSTPYVPPAFEGTRNLAKKASQPRVIHYNTAADWLAHQQQFGTSTSVGSAILRTLDQSARHVALMEKLGTNPMANLNQVIRTLQEKHRSDLDGVNQFQKGVVGIQNVAGRLDGSLNIPANEMWAKIGSTTRTMETTGSLGGVGLTHFVSIWPTVTSELVHHGAPRLQTLSNMIQALFRGKGTAARQDLMSDIGAYGSGLNRDMFARWQADDVLPGKVSSMANTFMKWTGIHYVFDNTQAAIREMLAHQLGRFSDRPFQQLEPHLSQMIGKYGIGPGEWELLRSVPNMTTSEGRAYMTPKDATRVDPAAAEALLRSRGEITATTPAGTTTRLVQQFITGLSDKIGSYYQDAADHGVVTAGVKERALLLGSTRPGSGAGEVMRFLTQFKMWPVAAMSQIVGREIYMSLSKKEMAANLFLMASLSASFGYLRMTGNDIALGHPPRNPLDHRTLLAALAQGGGVGIVGDLLFGEVNRMGGGLLDVLGGPVVSDADTLYKTFSRFREDTVGHSTHKNGQFADLWPELAHFGVRHIPFNNLIYLKGTLDYLLWYHLYEAASPGWWERTNRRMEREQGRGMTGYMPGGGVPSGVPWLYMKDSQGDSFGALGKH